MRNQELISERAGEILDLAKTQIVTIPKTDSHGKVTIGSEEKSIYQILEDSYKSGPSPTLYSPGFEAISAFINKIISDIIGMKAVKSR